MAYMDKAGLNYLAQKITNKMSVKVDKEEGKALSTNDYDDAAVARLLLGASYRYVHHAYSTVYSRWSPFPARSIDRSSSSELERLTVIQDWSLLQSRSSFVRSHWQIPYARRA